MTPTAFGVGAEGLGRVTARPARSDGEQRGSVTGEKAKGIVTDRSAGPEQNSRHGLEGNGIFSRIQMFACRSHKAQCAILDEQPAAFEPHQTVSVDMWDSGSFEAETTGQCHGITLSVARAIGRNRKHDAGRYLLREDS